MLRLYLRMYRKKLLIGINISKVFPIKLLCISQLIKHGIQQCKKINKDKLLEIRGGSLKLKRIFDVARSPWNMKRLRAISCP